MSGYDPYPAHQTPSLGPYYPMDYSGLYYGGLGSEGGGERIRGTEVQYGGGALFVPWGLPDPLQHAQNLFQGSVLGLPTDTGGSDETTGCHGDNRFKQVSESLKGRENGQSLEREKLPEQLSELRGERSHPAQPVTSVGVYEQASGGEAAVTHTLPPGPREGGGGPRRRMVILRGLPGSGKSTLAR